MSAESVRLAVNGAAGRMGRQLLSAIAECDEARLAAAIDAPGSDVIGLDTSILSGGDKQGIAVSESLASSGSDVDVIIDFTAPAVTLKLLEQLNGQDTAVVVGTTGFNDDQLIQLKAAATLRPIVFAPNYSIGVTVSLALLQQAATALGEVYDVEVIEAHHRHKVDAPSGTALAMGAAVADALDRDLKSCAIYGREGITGERNQQTIGFATVRAGDIIGEHTVLFAGNGERLEITHKATDRMTFSRGAVQAALWLKTQPPGLYDMTHVLGLA